MICGAASVRLTSSLSSEWWENRLLNAEPLSPLTNIPRGPIQHLRLPLSVRVNKYCLLSGRSDALPRPGQVGGTFVPPSAAQGGWCTVLLMWGYRLPWWTLSRCKFKCDPSTSQPPQRYRPPSYCTVQDFVSSPHQPALPWLNIDISLAQPMFPESLPSAVTYRTPDSPVLEPA